CVLEGRAPVAHAVRAHAHDREDVAPRTVDQWNSSMIAWNASMKPLCTFAAGLLLLSACSSSRAPLEEPAPFVQPDASTEPSPTCAEAFAEAKRAPVDLIVSIDQSTSMIHEIDSLHANINLLPSLLVESGLDYRVVMLAARETPYGDYGVCVPPPLGGPDCGSNGTVYRAVDQLVMSTNTLMLLLTTLNHADPQLAWSDFLRPEAVKVFIPITDDESSLSGASFDLELLGRRGKSLFGSAEARRYVFFPVIGSLDFPSTATCATSSAAGNEYQYLASLTNGKWFSVCQPSLGPILQAIGESVAKTLVCEVDIPEPPVGSTLDLGRINVRVTPENGPEVVVPQDPARPCHEGADGWQFSSDKKKIVLCGSSCATAKRSKINVGFGCTTVVR
ncbi:MAG: hypothetical protein K0S65_2571, partial [Labilithrix sp.]|nr:hypothetical protein [Labilithrix sp.]